MNDRLARIEVIVSDWASDDSDGIDDLDALCQIAEVLGIEVEARTPAAVRQFEAKLLGFGENDRIKLCELCLRRAIADNFVIHSAATPVSRVTVADLLGSDPDFTGPEATIDCRPHGCKCVFPESEKE